MKATLEQVAEDALNLPAEDRIALTRMLIKAMDAGPSEDSVEVEAAWQETVEKRLDEVLSGRIKSIPAAAVFEKLRSRYG